MGINLSKVIDPLETLDQEWGLFLTNEDEPSISDDFACILVR